MPKESLRVLTRGASLAMKAVASASLLNFDKIVIGTKGGRPHSPYVKDEKGKNVPFSLYMMNEVRNRFIGQITTQVTKPAQGSKGKSGFGVKNS